MKLIFNVLLLLIMQSCVPSEGDDCHKELFFQNNDEESKYIVWTEKVIVGDECNLFLHGELQPQTRAEILGSDSGCLETLINNVFNGAVIVYVFEENPSIKECESVASHPDIIERREYTVDDLNANNWLIEYP